MPNLRDAVVTGALASICFGGPILCALMLPRVKAARPTRRSRFFRVSARTAGALWLTAEAAWLVHRRHLRASHEPWTAPDLEPTKRRQHLRRFLLLKVGRCRLPVSKPVESAYDISA